LNREKGITIIAAIHDLNLAARFFDRMLLLSSGRVLAAGTAEEVIAPGPIKTAYGVDALIYRHPLAGCLQVSVRNNTDDTKTKQPPIHLIGGGEEALPVMEYLRRQGYPLSTRPGDTRRQQLPFRCFLQFTSNRGAAVFPGLRPGSPGPPPSPGNWRGRVFKPTIFTDLQEDALYFNRAENGGPVEPPEELVKLARDERSPLISLCARLEAEIGELPDDEKGLFLKEYGLKESQVKELLQECYHLLDLITFYTVKGEEARAWFIPRGTTALEAAFKVHTDIGRGFINAEVISWDLLIEAGGLTAAREQGAVRTEGRDYPVVDGDVLYIRFRD